MIKEGNVEDVMNGKYVKCKGISTIDIMGYTWGTQPHCTPIVHVVIQSGILVGSIAARTVISKHGRIREREREREKSPWDITIYGITWWG